MDSNNKLVKYVPIRYIGISDITYTYDYNTY